MREMHACIYTHAHELTLILNKLGFRPVVTYIQRDTRTRATLNLSCSLLLPLSGALSQTRMQRAHTQLHTHSLQIGNACTLGTSVPSSARWTSNRGAADADQKQPRVRGSDILTSSVLSSARSPCARVMSFTRRRTGGIMWRLAGRLLLSVFWCRSIKARRRQQPWARDHRTT